jgi:hypothetical protein
MAASPIAALIETARTPAVAPLRTLTDRQVAEFSGVFRGRELTRKDRRRLSSGIATLDTILEGGIVRGRVSEIVGRSGCGRTSLAASFAAVATRRGEVAAWIDSSGAFDPRSIAAAGADLSRILWVGADTAARARDSAESPAAQIAPARSNASDAHVEHRAQISARGRAQRRRRDRPGRTPHLRDLRRAQSGARPREALLQPHGARRSNAVRRDAG